MLAVFVGMRVELSEKLGTLLKSTPGVIEHVLLHPREDMGWCVDGSPQRRDGEVVLRYLPSLLVRLDGYADGPIPGRPDLALLEPSFDFALDRLERGALNDPANDKQDCSRLLVHQGGEGRARHLGGYVRVVHFFEGGVAVGLQPDHHGVGVVPCVLDGLDSVIFDQNALPSERGAHACNECCKADDLRFPLLCKKIVARGLLAVNISPTNDNLQMESLSQ